MDTEKLEFFIPTVKFKDTIRLGPSLAKELDGATGVLGLHDMRMLQQQEHGRINASPFPLFELIDLLRQAKDTSGKLCYTNAQIKYGKVDLANAYSIQTYVKQDTLKSLQELDLFLRSFGFSLDSGEACLVSYEGKEKVVAIYTPPILSHYSSDGFRCSIDNVRNMILENRKIVINGVGGPQTIDLVDRLNKAEAIIKKEGEYVPIIKDGTHRAYTRYLSGAPLSALVISTQGEIATNIPTYFSDVIVSITRPTEYSEQYLGYNDSGFVKLKKIGIDS